MAAESAAVQTAVEVKFGQVGVATAFLRSADANILRTELQHRLAAAPTLFMRAPLVLDLSRVPDLPDRDATRALVQAVRDAGMLPVGLAYGTSENARLAESLNLPLFAKFRQQAEPAEAAPLATGAVAVAADAAPSALHHARAVRSGQQVYARQRDLVVCAAVGSGAEIVADGSIHIYGRLGGRALAGARGDTGARIYCQEFQAELISIAGHYRVLEDVPAALHGKPVQAWLDGERLVLEKL
jgi:septum site-determining protein MinC